MSVREGSELLHAVGVRILARYLETRGERDVCVLSGSRQGREQGVDLTFSRGDSVARVKVKVDAYQGSDASLASDRSLVFYRLASRSYAFEEISDHRTREPGWALRCEADELYYYRVAITQLEAEVSTLMSEPDAVFFSELAVESDELDILPMGETREWFSRNCERYVPRPVASGDHSAWVRLVPSDDLRAAVPSMHRVGPVFAGLDAYSGKTARSA